MTNLQPYLHRKTLVQKIASPAPDAATASEVRDLQSQGFTRIAMDDPELPALLETCQRIVAERSATAARTGKEFFAQLLTPKDIETLPCLMQAALNPHVIEVLSRSYGQIPFLESIELLSSFPSGPQLKQSQLWHMDRTDNMVVKQVIYINDVGDDEGPFTLVPPRESRKVPAVTAHYLTDEQIARYCDMETLVRFSGPAGSRALVDTGHCFHYGSRVRKPRHALFIYYNTGYGHYPRIGHWSRSFAEMFSLSEIQRKVLDI